MSKKSEQPEQAAWDARPLIEWLLDEGRFLPDLDDLVRQMGDRMVDGGAPIWRLRLSFRTLHPLTTGITAVWEADEGTATRMLSTHGLERRPAYVGSPFEIIAKTRRPFRKRLAAALTDGDHIVLHELKARGGTDYFALPLRLTSGTSAVMVFATNAAGGFSEDDIAKFQRIASVMALVAEAYRSRDVSLAVAEAYLGRRTGRRVLEGQITRGHIDTIDAAILVSDIRDWTGLNVRHSPEDALAIANGYFEAIAEAVENNGGEILKLIGDGVLAVFPTDPDGPDDRAACANALSAARRALEIARDTEQLADLRFGMGIHFGEVLYGNVGSRTRLDFTVLGQAVNVAARIEGLCGKLGAPILFSDEVAARLSDPGEAVAEEDLKGLDRPIAIRTVSPSV